MQLVNIDQLHAGDTVASAITNEGGAVLCPVGFKLTEQAIVRLKNAGVDFVIVESDQKNDVSIELRLQNLEQRFENVDDPIMLQIKATIQNTLNFMRI